jgi:hypothetical protein
MVFGHLCDLFSLNLLVIAYEFLAVRFVYPTHLNLNTVYVHNFLCLPTFFLLFLFSLEFTLLVSVGVRV